MNATKGLLLAGVLLLAAIFWQQHQHQQKLAALQAPAQPLPLGVYQSPTQKPAFTFGDFTLTPLAAFSVHAQVLSQEAYWVGTEAQLSPLDLALGWDKMAQPAVYNALNIQQGGRWYRYQWQGEPPIPPDEIVRSSANMHLIPADQSVEHALKQTRTHAPIQLQGYLVEVAGPNGWHWRSSLSRTDSGQGACEVFYVETVGFN